MNSIRVCSEAMIGEALIVQQKAENLCWPAVHCTIGIIGRIYYRQIIGI